MPASRRLARSPSHPGRGRPNRLGNDDAERAPRLVRHAHSIYLIDRRGDGLRSLERRALDIPAEHVRHGIDDLASSERPQASIRAGITFRRSGTRV